MENGELKVRANKSGKRVVISFFHKRSFVVFAMLTNNFISSSAFENKSSNSEDDIYPLSFNNRSQYKVSFASLREMFILCKKSARLWACSPSRINAPIAVPLRNNCFDNTNSFRSPVIDRHKPIMERAKAYDFSATIFCPITKDFKRLITKYTDFAFQNQLSILHSQLSILNSTFNFQLSINK